MSVTLGYFSYVHFIVKLSKLHRMRLKLLSKSIEFETWYKNLFKSGWVIISEEKRIENEKVWRGHLEGVVP